MKKFLIILAICSTQVAYAARHVPSQPESYIVADQSGLVLREQEADTIRPIASISKLMTTLIASEQDLTEILSVPQKRDVESSIPLRVKQLTRKELITLALVKSDNLAAQVLCDNIENCIDRMNMRAQDIGMSNTHYVEPTGLDKGNVSTARDLMKLAMVAMNNPTLSEISSMPEASIPIEHGNIRIRNTNPLVKNGDIVLSKTGFTHASGGCILMSINKIGGRLVIILGSQNTHTRILEAQKLYRSSVI